MFSTDPYVVFVLEATVICFSLYAIYRDREAATKSPSSGFQAEVTRGDKSMATIHTVYGAAIASALVFLNNTEVLEGNKVLLVAINFSSFTYLFYFSSWFRNSIFFPVLRRVRKD
jgi:hypothetical protein